MVVVRSSDRRGGTVEIESKQGATAVLGSVRLAVSCPFVAGHHDRASDRLLSVAESAWSFPAVGDALLSAIGSYSAFAKERILSPITDVLSESAGGAAYELAFGLLRCFLLQ